MSLRKTLNLNKRKLFTFKELGLAEVLVALLPILGAYYLGPVPFSFWILLLLSFVSLIKCRQIDVHTMRPLIVFLFYYLIHETILYIISNSYNFNINNRIERSVFLVSVLFVVPLLNFNKLKASLNFVALICMIGLLYQYSIVIGGGAIHPLEIPGLHMMETRLLEETNRPSSFFMEPAAYSFYMYALIAISLIDRRYIWTGILILSVFLSSSTSGIFASFILLGGFMVTQGLFNGRSFIVLTLAALLFFALTNTDFFDIGINKFENTNFETNIRIWQGPFIVRTMHFEELIFGAPYSDIADYIRDGRVPMKLLYGNGTNAFMSTFWYILFNLGLIGLLLYLNIFFKIAKNCKQTLPLVLCLFVIMFTGSMSIGVLFVYSLIVLYLMKKTYMGLELQKKN